MASYNKSSYNDIVYFATFISHRMSYSTEVANVSLGENFAENILPISNSCIGAIGFPRNYIVYEICTQ